MKRMPVEITNMTEQRQHARFQVEFPATFTGAYAGIGIVYNLGIGGCKVVSDLSAKRDALLTVYFHVPERTVAITCSSHHSPVNHGDGIRAGIFRMKKRERTRLEQFQTTQEHLASIGNGAAHNYGH